MPEPTKIPRPFADSGDKNTIPESSGALGFASWQEGFPPITGTPFAQGGVAPKRADFNGVFNALSAAVVWAQQGGVYAYDATTDYEIGNITEKSGIIYICKTANGPGSSVKDPAADTAETYWARLYPQSGTFNRMFFSQTSGSYTAPYTGVFRITLKGGGGGGGYYGGGSSAGGGGEGGMLVFYETLTKNTSYQYTIGAGGSGGVASTSTSPTGGGSSTFNNGAYSVDGGAVGYINGGTSGGAGGRNFVVPSGKTAYFVPGAPGGWGTPGGTQSPNGGGQGAGFRVTASGNGHRTGVYGGGGQGGGSSQYPNGGAGGAGFILIEYAE